jgi:hypothetical protein
MVRGSTSSSLIGSLARGLPRLGETAKDWGIKDIWRDLIVSKNSGGPDIRSAARNLARPVAVPPSHPLHHPEPPGRQRQAVPADGGVFAWRVRGAAPPHPTFRLTTCTCSAAAGRSTVERLTFRAVTRTLTFHHTWQSSTKAMIHALKSSFS